MQSYEMPSCDMRWQYVMSDNMGWRHKKMKFWADNTRADNNIRWQHKISKHDKSTQYNMTENGSDGTNDDYDVILCSVPSVTNDYIWKSWLWRNIVQCAVSNKWLHMNTGDSMRLVENAVIHNRWQHQWYHSLSMSYTATNVWNEKSNYWLELMTRS
jgi:hypothetical protein